MGQSDDKKYRTLVESSPDGILSVDSRGHIVDCNKAVCRLLGYKRGYLQGRDVRELIADSAMQTGPSYRASLDQPGLLDGEFELIRQDSQPIPVWAKEVRLRDANPGDIQSVIYLRDIAEHKRVEQLKDEFISFISHELRSPLTVITGVINTALTEGEHLPPYEMRQLLQDAASESENLSHILGNLLELSRAQANRPFLHIEPVNLGKIAWKVVDNLRGQSSAHRLVLDLPRRLPPVQADEVRLERILYNLMENGIKYSPGGGEVRVSARRDGKHLTIRVSDQGIGISPEDQAKLFQPFHRLGDPRINRVKGVGLGLLVCRRLVEAQGGQIWVESKLGHGTTFFFTLPIKVKHRLGSA